MGEQTQVTTQITSNMVLLNFRVWTPYLKATVPKQDSVRPIGLSHLAGTQEMED